MKPPIRQEEIMSKEMEQRLQKRIERLKKEKKNK